MGKTQAPEADQQGLGLRTVSATIIDLRHEVTMEVDESRHGSMLAPMPAEGDLFKLIERHRVLVCAGAGGVGKTTMSAALATVGASLGKRTLCFTIDPARRLAQAFGIKDTTANEVEVVPQVLTHAQFDRSPGTLTVMMLDPRETFDEIVQAGLGAVDHRQRVLSLRVYDHLAQNLAGTQAYMAMEKVCAIMNDPRWDLIVLDTPPSAKVLDFFDAPRRMEEILDSPATRALVTALRGGERLRPGFLGAGVRAALSGMQRVTGSSLLSDVAELIASMNQLLGGFGDRARSLKATMRSGAFGYVLVTSPDATVVSEAADLAQAMHERDLGFDALICNRVAQGGAGLSDAAALDAINQLHRAIKGQELSDTALPAPGLMQRALTASRYEDRRRERQMGMCDELIARLSSGRSTTLTSFVAELTPQQAQLGVGAFAEALVAGTSGPLRSTG